MCNADKDQADDGQRASETRASGKAEARRIDR
jgi:hypothetical protein